MATCSDSLKTFCKNPMRFKVAKVAKGRACCYGFFEILRNCNYIDRSNSFGAEHQLLNSQSAKLHVCMNDVAAAMVHDNLNAA